jgi:hypothetical protein
MLKAGWLAKAAGVHEQRVETMTAVMGPRRSFASGTQLFRMLVTMSVLLSYNDTEDQTAQGESRSILTSSDTLGL